MKPTDLRGILQYIPRFREKVFVLSVDGAIVTEENFANILTDVAVLRSLNIRVVMVHGAGAQIKALAEQQGVTPSDTSGSGVTDAPKSPARHARIGTPVAEECMGKSMRSAGKSGALSALSAREAPFRGGNTG